MNPTYRSSRARPGPGGLVLLAALSHVQPAGAEPDPSLPRVGPDRFNAALARLGEPWFWAGDTDANGYPTVQEMVPAPGRFVLSPGEPLDPGRLETMHLQAIEVLRLDAVGRELDQGRSTLMQTDLSDLPAPERSFAAHMLKVALLVDDLYQQQNVGPDWKDAILGLDPPSRTLYLRNAGPWCVAPDTESDPLCNAVSTFPRRSWNVWPDDVAHTPAFCAEVAAHPEAAALQDPFVVVRRVDGDLRAVPYNEAFGPVMEQVARELRGAARALADANEAPLVRYLEATARGFETNAWEEADEAWVAMNATNSRWYLRVAPDETYWDVCQVKAGFGMTLGLVDPASLAWQERLLPYRQEMEDRFARAVGASYRARKVEFGLPDFLRVVLYAGDGQSPLGATLGQTLPNFGRVAEAGRGRTMVMTNIRTDADSLREMAEQAALLYGPATLAAFSTDPDLELIDTLLHEAGHNLGPQDRGAGSSMEETFGAALWSVLDELRAQSVALAYVDFLQKKGLLDAQKARGIYVRSLLWSFRHIAEGMETPDGLPKAYSQLAAVQVGFLVKEKALRWVTVKDPTTGRESGRFEIDFDRLPRVADRLLARVGRILATGDARGARDLVEPWVHGAGRSQVHMDEIRERFAPYPDVTLVFDVRP